MYLIPYTQSGQERQTRLDPKDGFHQNLVQLVGLMMIGRTFGLENKFLFDRAETVVISHKKSWEPSYDEDVPFEERSEEIIPALTTDYVPRNTVYRELESIPNSKVRQIVCASLGQKWPQSEFPGVFPRLSVLTYLAEHYDVFWNHI